MSIVSLFSSLSAAVGRRPLETPVRLPPDIRHPVAAESGRSAWPGAPTQAVKLSFVSNGVLLMLGLGLGVVTAVLVVTGNWYIAVGLILALPAMIVLHKYPFLAVLVWLTLGPFLMTTETVAERGVYWVIHRALPPATLGIIIIMLSALLRFNQRRLPRLGWAEFAMAGYAVAGPCRLSHSAVIPWP